MLGVCYYPEHWPESFWAEDARRMREAGITYVRIGEFAWSRLEPERDRFEWGWLDRAIDTLARVGLRIVLGTPTCTPPKWVVDAHPDMLPVDKNGHQRGFGSRRHYSFSSAGYRQESRRIVEILARRYGRHPALVGWQTDNEYGCHDTILSWSETDLLAFRQWLRRRYQSPVELNSAWGNVFWSMEVTSFDQVTLPTLAVTETNPAARLDFWRFHSEQVADYNQMQCDILREHSPGRWITHNFMGFFHDFDHWPVGRQLDLASWDSYPIGFVERLALSEEERGRWARTSHPDIAAFHHDLYRGVGQGRFWVMEQQPGPVNWAPWNPVPAPGMIRLFTFEALAHGAEVVSYFRWRQAVSGQEQMHAGLNLPFLHEWSAGGREAVQVGQELATLPAMPDSLRADVAIVFDYEAFWITRIQPQGADFDVSLLMFRWYEAVRRLGLDVDFVAPGASLAGYRLVLVPCMPHVGDRAERAFAAADGMVLYGPRTGSKTRHFSIPENLPPGPLAGLLGARVLEVASLRPQSGDEVRGDVAGAAVRWRERLELTDAATVMARFANDDPALLAFGNHHYLACWPETDLLMQIMRLLVEKAGLDGQELPDFIRLRRRGSWLMAFNYGKETWPCPIPGRILLGQRNLQPQQLCIIETMSENGLPEQV